MRLINQLWKASQLNAERVALESDDYVLTYQEMFSLAARLALRLKDYERPHVVVWCEGHPLTPVAILACVLAQKTYVPVSPEMPFARIFDMIKQLDCDLFLTTKPIEMLNGLKNIDYATFFKKHLVCSFVDEEISLGSLHDQSVNENDVYILFTSGSTGLPKGVPVSGSNLEAYLANIQQVIKLQPDDRCSQNFNFSFDLSVHDLFVTWVNGARLCLPSLKDKLFPLEYIKRQRLSVWFSVPTQGLLANRLGVLKEGCLPSLRYVLFCGEALPAGVAKSWAQAARQAELINLYGPTEATIAVTAYTYERESPKLRNEVVAIGKPFGSNKIAQCSCTGELYLSGPQVVKGYLNDHINTQRQFKSSKQGIKYASGDIVHRVKSGELHFLERKDLQVKVRGFRVELSEVESVYRRLLKNDGVFITALNQGRQSATEFILVYDASIEFEFSQIHRKAALVLPDYMLATKAFALDVIPVNASGKTDRKAIQRLLRLPDLDSSVLGGRESLRHTGPL